MEETNAKSTFKELIRFLICGAAAAITDYLFCQLSVLVLNAIPNFNTEQNWIWITIISTIIGFIAGVIVNYIISTYWVYQNVREDVDTKALKFKINFVLFSLAAMLLSVLTMVLCNLVVTRGLHMSSIIKLSIFNMLKEDGIRFLMNSIFWAFFISFVIKTLVGLIFNYFTRKHFLYKS